MAEQPDFSSGHAMLALYPPAALAQQLALADGSSPDDMHCTLVYLGSSAGLDLERLRTAAEHLAQRQPVTAQVSGHARFTGAGDRDVLVALVDSPGLEQLRRDAVDTLAALGISSPSEHGYTAHITLQWLEPDQALPVDRLESVPLEFGALALVVDSARILYPFADPDDIGPYAREAFWSGWAASRGPITERVRAAGDVAVRMAREHADDPHILEATLKLGSLEGMWAELYERREKLYAAHTDKVRAAWQKLVGHLDVRAAVAAYRHQAGLGETTPDEDRIRALAQAAARNLLQNLLILRADNPSYQDILTALADALRTAQAEGGAGGIAIAAQQLGVLAIDFELAFQDQLDALGQLDEYWAAAKGWLGDIVQGAAGDLGRLLARLTEEGAGSDEMIDAASDLLGSDDFRAVSAVVDLAMGQSMSRGTLAVYVRAGARETDYITAADARVCPICQRYEDNNPYPLDAAPIPPAHPFCLVGSTRVAAPSRAVVTGDVPVRLAPHPTTGADGGSGDSGALTAAAVTEPGRDFGRSNLRAVTVREFVGETITIRTASGKELTGTPNHPVATRGGWVALAELHVGDHVLSSTRPEWEPATVDPDVDDVPPRIEQVAESFPVALGPMPTAAEDFHGDGAGSQVHVVRTDGLLVDDLQAACPEHVGQVQLGRGDVAVDPALAVFGPLYQPVEAALGAAHSVMGSLGELRALLGRGLGHAQGHAGAAPSGLHARVDESLADRGAADAERLGQGLLALASQVPVDDGLTVEGDALGSGYLALGSDRNASVVESVPDGQLADSEGFCERYLGLACDVAADEIVGVQRQLFRGHVYNLDTLDGWYIGNGILTHNCRCNLQPTDPLQALDVARYALGGES